jgi:adenylylsulfate kinase-like enzyme
MTYEPGRVIWITGLSGAGKSTLAHEVEGKLRHAGKAVVMLDGDELRAVFGAAEANVENHGREGRLALAKKYSHLCLILASQGLTVVIATISLFRELHSWNRANLPGYFEVCRGQVTDAPYGSYNFFNTHPTYSQYFITNFSSVPPLRYL